MKGNLKTMGLAFPLSTALEIFPKSSTGKNNRQERKQFLIIFNVEVHQYSGEGYDPQFVYTLFRER